MKTTTMTKKTLSYGAHMKGKYGKEFPDGSKMIWGIKMTPEEQKKMSDAVRGKSATNPRGWSAD
tara:strand:- start:541 stop:732 length:192 start_codon:yes stop_codon:yes gene_type:complete